MKARALRLDITKEDIERELKRIAFADLRDIMTWNGTSVVPRDSKELNDDEAPAVESVTKRGSVTSVKLYNKIEALLALAKMCGFIQPTRIKTSQGDLEIGGIDSLHIYIPDNGRQVALPEASSPGITRVLDAPTNGHHPVEIQVGEDGPLDGMDPRP